MPVNAQQDSKNYSIPPKIQEKTLKDTIETTLSQIAHANLMARYYRKLGMKQSDKKKREAYSLKAQQLEDGRELNYGFLEHIGYKPGDLEMPTITSKLLKTLFG